LTQNAPISHIAGGDENDIKFKFHYTVTDGDGDTAPGYIWVNVDDDTPIATSPVADGNVSDVIPGGAVALAVNSLNISWGADKAGSVQFASTDITDTNGHALSSGGIELKYVVIAADGSTNPLDQKLVAYTGGNAADASSWVFSVNLTSNSAAYQFVLYKPLD